MAGEGDVDESKRATLRRFAALGAASPLVGFAGAREGGDSDARDAIAGYLAATPGAHFSKVRDDLQLGTGETQYHLRRLEEAGVVESRKDGDYKRFFPAGRFTDLEQVTLGFLRRETPRGILLHLLEEPAASGSDIAAALDVSRATVSKHVGSMAEAGLLTREDGYSLEAPETTLLLVVRYADSLGPDADALASTASELLAYDPSTTQ